MCMSINHAFLASVQSDRTYAFSFTSPPNSYFLKAAAGVEKGSSRPGAYDILIGSSHVHRACR